MDRDHTRCSEHHGWHRRAYDQTWRPHQPQPTGSTQLSPPTSRGKLWLLSVRSGRRHAGSRWTESGQYQWSGRAASWSAARNHSALL